MRREFLACFVVSLFVMQAWTISGNEFSEIQISKTFHYDDQFNQSGYVESGTYTTPDGESHITRPRVQWTTPSQLLAFSRTGACTAVVDSLDEVWLMGGRFDPDPAQNNDETPTDVVEILRNGNKTWEPSFNMLYSQQYCEAEIVGDLIFVIGDWLRGSNPVEYPSGRVQIHNLSNDTWYNGTPMPSTQERGLGGMAEHNGYLYYAGGVRNPSGNDATNKTFRYDPVNDNWTRMADMNQPRASFELINFHGQLYAMGGFQGTQTWNRQGLDYVERYDPPTDTWTNLSALPVGMFGWGGTVLNDEIVLVGGYNGGSKRTVYHWNPIEDTWSNGIDIGSNGHFDLEVEEINGSIVWASGDTSAYPYNTWQQSFSQNTEYQNASSTHSGWITSPGIDLRPNVNGRAVPVQFDLQGNNTPEGMIGFQYRAARTYAGLTAIGWIGSDSTVNTTFPLGTTDIDLDDYANFVQYRIKMTVINLSNWDEPNLDSMAIHAEHAAFESTLPSVLNPRGDTVTIQTSHDTSSSSGEMYLELAPCDSSGALSSDWSRMSYESGFTENDSMNLFLQSSGIVNSSSISETLVDWSFDLGDLTIAGNTSGSEVEISHLCAKVGTSGAEDLEYIHTSTIRIDRTLHVNITGINNNSVGDAITGGYPLQIELNHSFPETGKTLTSGDLQSRVTFNIHVIDPETNSYVEWVNQTTPWIDIAIGQTDTITWELPSNVSGNVDINLESRSDQPLLIVSNSNSWNLLLDNDNPVILSSKPALGTYVDSIENRELSLLIADTSGFISSDIALEVWVEGLDDGSDGGILDGTPQEQEFREINYTLENNGSLWWINASQSDNVNTDDQYVYLRVVGTDNAGLATTNNTVWWTTRDAQNAVVESISNAEQAQYWEVSRDISWQVTLTDTNSIYDIISMKVELGDDSEFGVIYNVADMTCSSLDYRIDSDRTTCNHDIEGQNMIISITLYSGWEVDRSVLNEGEVKLTITDLDGSSSVIYQNLWIFSEDFDFTITGISDVTGLVTGNITNESIVITGETIQIEGIVTHSLSGTPYQGDLSLSWWGLIQGKDWFGAGTVSVVDGQINASIPMPNTGGVIDISVAFMDPLETKVIGSYDFPVFDIDPQRPIILDTDTEGYSRYHLENIEIGVNINEDVSWTGELKLTCQVISTDLQWEPINISMLPSNVFQGKTLFSFDFDFSGQGDPSLLSPESHIDCWAEGYDDAGWGLISETGSSLNDPWLTLQLSTVGPNIELQDVKFEGNPEPGKEIRVEISVMNTGEGLQQPFNITVYTVSGDERTLVGRFKQGQIASDQGIIKRVGVTVPEGDWTLEIYVDEDQQIWELNEDDNSFSKDFDGPEKLNYSLIAGIGSGFGLLLLIMVVIIRRKNNNRLSGTKELPVLDDLARTGPPQANRSSSKTSKPKKGPPPKKVSVPVDSPKHDISDAMAKLSLSSLPGNMKPQPEKVSSFELLPGGGEYEYLEEGTYYSGEQIGKWKLEEDGSFTKQE